MKPFVQMTTYSFELDIDILEGNETLQHNLQLFCDGIKKKEKNFKEKIVR